MVKRCRPKASFTIDPGVRAAVRVRAALSGESQSDIVERGMSLALAGRVLAFHGPTCPGCGADSGTADSPASTVGPALAPGHLRCCAGCGAPDWPVTQEEIERAHGADAEWELATHAVAKDDAEWALSLETMDAVAAETTDHE